jgi:hypothetical protein
MKLAVRNTGGSWPSLADQSQAEVGQLEHPAFRSAKHEGPGPQLRYLGGMHSLEIVLVRHAEPVPPGTPGWEERDDERPLSAEGLRQAQELAFELEPYILTACYASPYPRA